MVLGVPSRYYSAMSVSKSLFTLAMLGLTTGALGGCAQMRHQAYIKRQLDRPLFTAAPQQIWEAAANVLAADGWNLGPLRMEGDIAKAETQRKRCEDKKSLLLALLCRRWYRIEIHPAGRAGPQVARIKGSCNTIAPPLKTPATGRRVLVFLEKSQGKGGGRDYGTAFRVLAQIESRLAADLKSRARTCSR
jgi:hypothetical protein